MNILIAGANGKIGRHLLAKLANSKHRARAMIRDKEQAPELLELGAFETVVADLEGDVSEALRGMDAVVFTAGSGPHTGPDKTIDVDQNGAINLIEAAEKAGVKRFLMVSTMRADKPETGPEKMHHYFVAKQKADNHLRASSLDYTIVRPGKLTEQRGTGKVEAAERLDHFGEIPREDVARALVATIEAEHTFRHGYDLLAGDVAIKEAIGGLTFSEES
jgi:uncharacterized protein YbjT (DUF2867 family)